MSMKIKQLISATLTMIMIFSLFSGNIVHAANVEATAYALNSLFLKVHPEIII